jgi:hypothetical protein
MSKLTYIFRRTYLRIVGATGATAAATQPAAAGNHRVGFGEGGFGEGEYGGAHSPPGQRKQSSIRSSSSDQRLSSTNSADYGSE